MRARYWIVEVVWFLMVWIFMPWSSYLWITDPIWLPLGYLFMIGVPLVTVFQMYVWLQSHDMFLLED